MTELGAPLVIVYASQTGNAQDVAEGLGRQAVRRHYAVRVVSADAYDPIQLPTELHVVFVTATAGQGDPPDNFKRLWRFLLRKSLPATSLQAVHVAVFGLGDSGYQKYNVVAKRLAKRLEALGAKQLTPLGLGDDQHKNGFEGALDPWCRALWSALRQRCPLPPNSAEPHDADGAVPPLGSPKFAVRQVAAAGGGDCRTLAQAAAIMDQASGSGASMASGAGAGANDGTFGPAAPYAARLAVNRRLTAREHPQDVRHLEVELGDSGLSYRPGDSLAMWPRTRPQAVEQFLSRCRLDGSATITVQGPGGAPTSSVSIRTLVAGALDVSSACPRRYFFEVLAHWATEEHERERLQYFASVEGRDDLYRYCNKERRSVLEVLGDFPSATPPLPWLLTVVPRLQPRYFSISSSPLAHPSTVHLTVAVVAWTTPYKRPRVGLCTSWLSQLEPSTREAEVTLDVWVAPGSLQPPPSVTVPLIAVGPGTGVAPMRSLLQDRDVHCRSDDGATVGPAFLFFGCRREAGDCLYADQWADWTKPGRVLASHDGLGGLVLACSQDQPKKLYVTHRLREHGAAVWTMMEQGGHVYVSGAAGKMPRDVLAALEDVVATHGAMTPADAKQWVRRAETARKIQVETWA